METAHGSPEEHAGISLIFTSSNLSRFKELTKNGWQKVMPTWSANEQAHYFSSTQFQNEYSQEVAQSAYDNIQYFGGSITRNINAAFHATNPVKVIEKALLTQTGLTCERFKAEMVGVEDLLEHQNPVMIEGKYDFNNGGAYSFASPYVLRRLLQLQGNTLVTQARNRYSKGPSRGGDDGNGFSLLCLHGFKISGVKFVALPLTAGAKQTTVVFPPKQVLALNWQEQKNYLQSDVLYLPHYGNLECGNSFCLIKIKKRWTLIILQCTIAEHHPVKLNGAKIIYEGYVEKAKLKVDDTVIMFMTPVNGKLKTKQAIVTKGEEVSEEIQGVTVEIAAQYKIENALVTVDDV